MRKSMIITIILMSLIIVPQASIVLVKGLDHVPRHKLTGLSSGPLWDYGFALKVNDTLGDTQTWSTNATICAIGNTSETNAEFDPARDLEAFWLTYDNETVYFRIYVNDLVSNDSLQLGAMYNVHFDAFPYSGTRDCQWDGRTYVAEDAAWDRSVGITFGGNLGQNILKAYMIGTDWSAMDDTNSTPHQISQFIFGPGKMTVDANFAEDYVEVSFPWEDLMILPGQMPETMNITVMSFKPGEWNTGFSPPYRLTFEPGDPGAWGREWQINDKGPVWGPDAADVMPGGQNEIDWDDCWLLMGDNWDILSRNTVDSYYTVQVKIPSGPTADFTYSPLAPHETWNVTFNASVSLPGFNGTSDAPIVSYTWDFGDDTPKVTEATPVATHNYTTRGSYSVTLNVTDTTGLWDTEEKSIEILPITPYGPTANFIYTPPTPNATLMVRFNARGSSPGWNGTADMPIVSYEWDFGDNTTGTNSTPTHIYTLEGVYDVTLNVTDPRGLWNATWKQITVSPFTPPGYVHVSSRDPHYFEFDDGTPFFPIGINKGWILTKDTNRGDGYQGVGDTSHTGWNASRYFQEMKAHNMNFVRIWMSSWHINIEQALGVYNENEAQKLDYLLELAEQYDIYVMLTLLTFTDFNTWGNPEKWAANPYNKVNGGPCDNPVDFLTNDEAKRYIKRRFNYILNRWGSNRRIAMWEFWNEVSLVSGANDTTSKAWHEDVAQVFRENDTFRRPLTTSFHGDVFYDQTIRSDAIDVIQIHTYRTNDDIQIAQTIGDYVKYYYNYNKPIMVSEYGTQLRAEEPEHCNNGIWAAVALGAGGASLRWASNIYDNYGDLTDAMFDRYLYFQKFVQDIQWTSLNLSQGTGTISNALYTTVFSLQRDDFAIGWVQHLTSGVVSGAKLEFSGFSSGNYTLYVYEDSTGTYVGQYFVEVLSGNLAVTLPDFTDHLAVKVVNGTLPRTVSWRLNVTIDGETYQVIAFSNSSLNSFTFTQLDKKISFNTTELAGAVGYCNISIPATFLSANDTHPWSVLLDGDPITYQIKENGNHTFIYFTYNQSAHQVEIIGTWMVPEFPANLLPLLLLIITALAVAAITSVKKNKQESV